MAHPIALITGASSGIGRVYADRLAARGYNLILVARNLHRLEALAEHLHAAHGIKASTCHADLAIETDMLRVTKRLEQEPYVSLLVNSAGVGPEGPVMTSDPYELEAMLQLNVFALHRLTRSAALAFASRGRGAIVNIASAVALMPERFNASYAATKAFVLALTQGLAAEMSGSGVRFQAVLPGLTRTEIFERAGFDLSQLDPEMIMEPGDLVDAALAGFDREELITIPSLSDAGFWDDHDLARRNLWPHLSLRTPAARYSQEQV